MQSDQRELSPATTRLLHYHFAEDHRPKGCAVFQKEMLLLFLGLGGLNYVPVAYQNGNTVTLSIINAVTTAILGEILLYTSGSIYYNEKIQPQYIDSVLQDIIQAPLTRKEFWQEIIGQGILATASAIPLATTMFVVKFEFFKQYPELFWVSSVFILGDNAVMHLVPMELTFHHPFYGWPLRQLLRAWRHSISYQPSVEEQCRLEQLELRTSALNEINPIIANAKENFLNMLAYETPEKIQARMQDYQNFPQQLFRDMLSCYKKEALLSPCAETIARFLGASAVSLACLGYAANPYLVFRREFGFSVLEAIASAFIPVYFFMVLMAFFGDGMGVRLLQNMLSVRDFFFRQAPLQKKISTIAKLNPIAFFISTLSILFVVAFAGAPAREMMKMAFENIFPAWLMTIMMGVVDIGIGMLAWYAPLDFTKIMLTHATQYFGAEREKSIAILKVGIEAWTLSLNHIKPEYIEAVKQDIDSMLPATQIEPPEQLIEAKSRSSCCARFYSSVHNEEDLDEVEAGVRKKLLLPGHKSGHS